MSDWPPKPQNDNTNLNSPVGQQPTGQEWKILEKAVLASVEEQRRTRRWGIFFKVLTFLYILFVLVALGKSCSLSGSDDGTITSENHLGVVNIVGTIDSSSQGVNSTDTIKSLKKLLKQSLRKLWY